MVRTARHPPPPRPLNVPRLGWRSATPHDRAQLQAFECTTREKRRGRTVYPRKWERDAEALVRRVNPRCDARSAVLIGTDDRGIAAVVSVGLYEPPHVYMVELVAVANRHRGRGGQVADEALDEAVQWILNRTHPADVPDLQIVADHHPRNDASRRLLHRYGFIRLTETTEVEACLYLPGQLF